MSRSEASGEEPGLHSAFMIYFTGSQQARTTQAPRAEKATATDPLRLAKQGPFKPSPGAAEGSAWSSLYLGHLA